MKILVMGAGAVGSYFGARLQQAGEEVVFCARGEHLRAMRERGLTIESFCSDFKGAVRATDDPHEFAPYDLVLFCVKAHHNDAAARSLIGCLAPGGAVLTLQNGVENEAQIAAILGRDAVMGGAARVGVEVVEPGRIVHLTDGEIEFGELSDKITERAERIAAMFRRAGILRALFTDLLTFRWNKLLWNSAFNTVTTLTRRTVGEIIDDLDGMRLIRTLMNETMIVGAAEGAKIGRSNIEALLAHSDNHLRPLKTSMRQDAERGRRIEYDALSGAVIRGARRHGIEVPATETIYALLKMLDVGAER
ncbi:MAG TPA: 2-dehydropantoate 2-reductase [Candidatus Binataceae bacterium]|nr:2-dehydropantoate 2-reductase [Candidatus Binataceae bacterium]